METKRQSPLYGFMAEFETPEQLLDAAAAARDAGYKTMDAYAPFPVEGLSEALGFRDKRVPALTLIGGFVGGTGGFTLLWWATTIAYPLNIAGRPLFGWPHFIAITFECTVLCAALTGVISMLVLNGLPMPYHPVFNVPAFARASSDRFFLCIEEKDARFSREETMKFLQGLSPIEVSEVER